MAKSSQTDRIEAVSTVLSRGRGMLRFDDLPVELVLLICGENNVLAYDRSASVLRLGTNASCGPSAALRGDWVLLNPAHEPYWPPITRTGFAKIRQTASHKGPTLKKLVMHHAVRQDGTRPPLAVVHSNNFDIHTYANASVVFAGPRCQADRVAELAREGAELPDWRFVSYELRLQTPWPKQAR
jgi:hypothetical protein